MGRPGKRIEHIGLGESGKIDDLISDRDTAAKLLGGAAPPKDREREVLDGKITVNPIGRFQPAARPRIVGRIERD
jgi:hypothetical protein